MRLLDEHGIPYLVGGAFCLGAYTGVIRDTKDFDLMMRPNDVARAIEMFRAEGYRAEMPFPHWLAKAHHGEAFIDIIFNSGNGLCGVDDRWFEHARPGELLGRTVQLCPPEEILWQKCYIMERERFDGADVIHLLRSCAAMLDWPRLVERFGPDWRVLLSHLILFGYVYPSKRSLIPVGIMTQLMERLLHETQALDEEDKRCNGTLLSRAQYLPDVERWGFADPRLEPRSSLTPDALQAWTAAITSPDAK
jgi:hypothetical protein